MGLLFLWLLLLVRAPLGLADLYTSSMKMAELAACEVSLIDSVLAHTAPMVGTIDVTFRGGPREDDNLRKFAEFRRKVIGTRGRDADEPLHPNAAMLLLRAFRSRWNDAINKSPELEKVFSAHRIQLPEQVDMDGILSGILRLQRTFNLTTANIYTGDYRGFQGPALSPLMAMDIGARAFSDGLLVQSVDWLRLVKEKMRLAASVPTLAHLTTDPDDISVYSNAQIAQVVALSGRAWFYLGNVREAARQLEESQRLDPASPEGLTLQEELKTTPPAIVAGPEDISNNMTILCSRPKDRVVDTLKPFHRCRLKPSLSVPYLRFKEEILSLRPYASVFHHVIHQREIDTLIALIKRQMSPATVQYYGRSYARVSERGWVHDKHNPVVRELSRRVREITWLRTANNEVGPLTSEPFQVLNYGIGGHYNVHIDNITQIDDYRLLQSGTRICTFLIYLSDVDIGGTTIFPQVGIAVPPVKGSALFWYNVNPAQEVEHSTQHAGCPVLKGHKWVSNKWIWTYGNMYRRPCGSSPSSRQTEVESIMYSRRHNIAE